MEEKPLTNRQVVVMGAVPGILAGMLILGLAFLASGGDQYGNGSILGLLIIPGIEITFSVIGAIAGKSWGKTWRAVKIGAILGSLLPILAFPFLYIAVRNGF